MLVLIVLLSCLVSILIITLLNIEKMNTQLIVFLAILVGLMLFKVVIDKLIKKNENNPLSKNLLSNVNVNNQSTLNEVVPSNFNEEVNNDHPFVNNNNNNAVANNNNNNTVANNNNNNAVANNNNNAVANNNNAVANNNNNNVAANNNTNSCHCNGDNNTNSCHCNGDNNTNSCHCNGNNSNSSNNHACLLDNTPCHQINNLACSNAANSDPNAICNAKAGTNFVNNLPVSPNCVTNNNVNYNDVFNVDSPLNQYNENILPPSGVNSNDCAFDNSCIVNADSGNMHLSSGISPGDPEFTEAKDYWKFKVNTNDMCYLKRSIPEFYNN
jgi:hypothetical protein